MSEQISHILSLVPAWQGAEARITPLSGGITNQNYRVDIGDESFVLRVGGKGTHLLGINRENEHTCTEIAASLGIGPEVLFYHASASSEVLITRFITGTNLSSERAAQADMLPRIAAAMRRYHNGPAFPGSFSPFATVRTYHRLALEREIAFPETLPRVFSLMTDMERAIGSGVQVKSCHNDLLASNLIDDGQVLRIVDWEYAGMGDPFFDLGNFAVNQSLDAEQDELLLQGYLDNVQPADRAHLQLMRLASDLRESFWGFLQMGISELDFDYREYAYHHLDRFLRHVEAAPFAQWLATVQR